MTETPTDSVQECLTFFQKIMPEPTANNIHTQMGVHFEEVGEMIDEIVPLNEEAADLLADARMALKALSDFLKANDNVIRVPPENRVDFLDALCDQIVTATGTAHTERMDIAGGMVAVNDSNYSKLDDEGNAIFDANGKFTKGPNYRKADLSPFV